MTAAPDDAAKWIALGWALAEVERMQFWRSRGQEPADVADGRADDGAHPHRAARDRADGPQPGRSAATIWCVPARRTPPLGGRTIEA